MITSSNAVRIQTDLQWHGTPAKGKLTIDLTAPGITTKEISYEGFQQTIMAAMKASSNFAELKRSLEDMLSMYMPRRYITIILE
jgi:hypothetical protein